MGIGVLLLAGLAGAQAIKAGVPQTYRDLFQSLGKQYGVDENLLHALAWHESKLNPLAVGAPNTNGTRDYGLFQINERNFAKYGLTSSTWQDPVKNGTAAARLIRDIQLTPGLSLLDTISIYNAGPSTVAGRVGGPKLDAAGAFANAEYVSIVWSKYLLVQIAAFGVA